MKKFHFSLETALRWRQIKADEEKTKVEAIAGEIARIDAARLAIDQEWRRIDHTIKESGAAAAADLHALEAFARYAASRKLVLESRKLECRRRLTEQQKFYIGAKREAELLEKIKERKRNEWKLQAAKELEELAGEAYLAKLIREAAREE